MSSILNVILLVLLIYVFIRERRARLQSIDNRAQLVHAQNALEDVSRQNVRLQREINTDGLTKIGNRAHFEITYRMEWDWSLRSKSTLAMLMVDIDLFKNVNDKYGHVVGDDCLVAVALAIRGCLLRGSDRVMRYGGEEFAVLLGGTDIQGVKRLSERILEAVRSLEFPQGFKLSVSIGGAAVMPVSKQKSQCFLEMVDVALYRAKHNGRDRVEILGEHELLGETLYRRQSQQK